MVSKVSKAKKAKDLEASVADVAAEAVAAVNEAVANVDVAIATIEQNQSVQAAQPAAGVKKGSKRAVALEIVVANPELSMQEVCKLIAEKINFNVANARAYFRYFVEKGLVDRKIETVSRSNVLKSRGEGPTKRQIAVKIMSENADKPMELVVPLIAKAINFAEANARSYYKNLVERKLAPGVVTEHIRKPRGGVVGQLTKRAIAAQIMNDNADKPMGEVVSLVAKAIGFSEAATRVYYKDLVERGVANGVVVPHVRKIAIKNVVTKTINVKTPKSVEAVLNVGKTAEEIEEIKKKNLARMRDVSKKLKATAYVSPVTSDADKQALLASVGMGDDDHPAFLTSDDVNVIV